VRSDNHDPPPRRGHRAADRLLAKAARQGGAWAIVVALASFATAGVSLVFPAVLGHAVDGIVTDGTAGPWMAWSAVLVVLLVAGSALDVLASGITIAQSTAWLRRSVLGHVLALGSRPSPRLGPGEMATRVVANASEAPGRAW
jgi:ATP-binding cassette subfamily B protein